MAIRPFLAMTTAEMEAFSQVPVPCAWMACHFSPYGTGLSNLPASLPTDSLLILNDRTPIHGHDPELIAQQLSTCIEALGCWGLLLDFQRPDCSETRELTRYLSTTLRCPVAVSEPYADAADCAVFLSPLPPSEALADHLVPWAGREVWLELALEGEVITLTEQGAEVIPCRFSHWDRSCFDSKELHCHYHIQTKEEFIRFTLWRNKEDLVALLKDAEACGVTHAIGLYQELSQILTE